MKRFLINFYFISSLLLVPISSPQEINTVYVYQDEGVSNESLKQIILSFKNLLKQPLIKTINAQQVQEGTWTKNAILFIMPGGADLPYVKKLNGRANEIIKQYVADGGAFLGICAGSYYASSYVEFNKNGPLEVLGNRELSFFGGSAIGPILAPYDYNSKSGSRAATIYTTIPNITKTIVFYNGGGFFKNAGNYPNTTVIGIYDNMLPAIILINYGKGKVLLSGVHFEYDPSLLNSQDKNIQKIMDKLLKGNTSRKVLLVHLTKLIGVE